MYSTKVISYNNQRRFFLLSKVHLLNLVKNLLNKRKFKFKIFGRNKRFNFSGFKLVFLISSIIPVLKLTNYIKQYYDIVLAFEQLFIM